MDLKKVVILVGSFGLVQLVFWILQLAIVGYHIALLIIGSAAIVGVSTSFIGLRKDKKNADDPGVEAYTNQSFWILILILAILAVLVWIATVVVNVLIFGPILSRERFFCVSSLPSLEPFSQHLVSASQVQD
jgi:peptidoglycan biosynthesis protein MviN/MurJ (putative lipid II flippase)